MTTPSAQKKPQRSVSEAIGRLYALWIISSCGLLLLIVIVTVLANNQTRHLLDELDRQQDAIAKLRFDLKRVNTELAALKQALRSSPRTRSGAAGTAPPPANVPAASPAAPAAIYRNPPVAAAAAVLDGVEQRLARGDRAGAAAQLAALGDGTALPLPLRLRFGRALVMLERWDALDRLLAGMSAVPETALESVNFLRAAADIHAGRLPEAVAILDHLLVNHPDDYELLLWRGIALLEAGRPQRARDTLDRATKHTRRPEGWYWRGVVELRADNDALAVVYFHKALAAAPTYAPAIEGLAVAALKRGDAVAAARDLARVLKIEPDRAEAHFLMARAVAAQHQRDAAARELRRALQLDPALLDRARQSPELAAMFSESQLRAMAGPKSSGAAAPAGERP